MSLVGTVLLMLTAGANSASGDELSIESAAGFGSASGRELTVPGSLVAVPEITVIARGERIAVELSGVLAGPSGSGEQPAYWALSPGVRYYVPLASTVRNRIAVSFEAFARANAGRVWTTVGGNRAAHDGYVFSGGGGLALRLSPVRRKLVVGLHLAGAVRSLRLNGARGDGISGRIFSGALGFSLGARL